VLVFTHPKEDLINSHLDEELCYSIEQHGPSAGNSLAQEHFPCGSPAVGPPKHRSHPHPLDSRHKPPTPHIEIRQPAADLDKCVFFASPRHRTLAQPKIRLITKNACSTFTRTFDFVRFRARGRPHRPRPASPCRAGDPVTPGYHARSMQSRPLNESV